MRSASSSILHRQKDDELNDDLLSTTLHELEQHCANKKENLEDLLNDISESVCPSTTTPQSDHNTQNNQRFQSCLDELSKPLIQSEVGHPSVASLEKRPSTTDTQNKQNNNSTESPTCPRTEFDLNLFKQFEEFDREHDDATNTTKMMESMIEAFLTKEVLGEPMQLLLESFKPWLEEYRSKNPMSIDLNQYEEQYRIFSEVLELCQCNEINQETAKICGQNTISTLENENPINRLQKFQLLMEKLQCLGEPPQEILDILFAMTDIHQEVEISGKKNLPKRNEELLSQKGIADSPNEASDMKNGNDRKIKDVLKSFESLIFGRRGSNLEEDRKEEFDDNDEEIMKEDIEGFLKFLKGLGLTGNESGRFLNPEILMRSASGDISEEELIQLIIGNDKS